MNYYALIQPLLFQLPPESAHCLAIQLLQMNQQFGILEHLHKPMLQHPTEVMGIQFPNPVGLAAGFDKNADCIDALTTLGFGFIEIGTVTPRAQTGNTKPRLFRLTEQQALLNHMGLNNKGIDYVEKQLSQRAHKTAVLGVSLGSNQHSCYQSVVQDYVTGFHRLAPYADYVVANLSCPNTLGGRLMQAADKLAILLEALKEEQQKSASYTPLAIKISPDLDKTSITRIAQLIEQYEVDAVIATNSMQYQPTQKEPKEYWGGLSGAPLMEKSTACLSTLSSTLHNTPLIGLGGILSREDASAKMKAGACLIQLYSGFIYRGSILIRECIQQIAASSAS